ncbi:MAG: hypothetical protein WCJ72_15935 [Chryseobacterium sp.]
MVEDCETFSVGNIPELLVIYRDIGSGMSRSEKNFGEVVAKIEHVKYSVTFRK